MHNVILATQHLLKMFSQTWVAAIKKKIDMDARCTKGAELIGLASDKLGLEDKGW